MAPFIEPPTMIQLQTVTGSYKHINNSLSGARPAPFVDQKMRLNMQTWRADHPLRKYTYSFTSFCTSLSEEHDKTKTKSLLVYRFCYIRIVSRGFVHVVHSGKAKTETPDPFSLLLAKFNKRFYSPMAFSTNTKPTIYRNLYENTGPGRLVAAHLFIF